jgi:hypothetical protein
MAALAVVLMPFWTSLMARTFAWVVLLQDNGVVNDLLQGVGVGRVRLLGTATGATLAMAQVMLPFMVLSVYMSMRGINRRLVDAAAALCLSGLTAHPPEAEDTANCTCCTPPRPRPRRRWATNPVRLFRSVGSTPVKAARR